MKTVVEGFGKRRAAFGLRWIPVREGIKEDIQEALGSALELDSLRAYYVKVGGRKGRRKGAASEESAGDGTIAFGIFDAPLKGVCSAAQVVAGLARDALYLVELEGGVCWYAGVREGMVISTTDMVGEASEMVSKVINLSAALDLPLFADVRTALDGLDVAEPFDFSAVLAKSKAPPLRAVSSGSKVLGPLIVAAVIGAMSFAAYRYVTPAQPRITPAQQRQLARQAYVSQVSSAVGSVPQTSQWVMDAYWMARNNLPPYYAGWQLEGVTCTPLKCTAVYVATPDSIYALQPMKARFGSLLTVLPDGASATVTYPLRTALLPVTDRYLATLQPEPMQLPDWVGRIPVALSGAQLDGQPLVDHLGQRFNAAAAGMPSATLEEVSVKSDLPIEIDSLAQATVGGAMGGFVPVKFTWSFGTGKQPAAWKMVWQRIYR